MRTAIAQFGPTIDYPTNIAVMRRLVSEAAEAGAELVIFPEESMLITDGLDRPLRDVVADVWPVFTADLAATAQSHAIALIAGGYEPNGTDRPNNTLVAFDSAGVKIAEYRKLHLYDAFAYKESAYVTPGTVLPPVFDVNGIRVGLINCYDIRFPELARHLFQEGAELLTVSAAWVAGPHKEDHWLTLARARAIENTVWLAAAGTISDECIGRSIIVDPLGLVVADLGTHPAAIAVIDISRERTDEVRGALPALDNRRIRLTYDILEHA